MYRNGSGCEEGEKSHAAIMEHQLSSVEQLVSQRIDIRRLREEEAKALKEENYEAAELLNKKLEEMTILSEWDIAGNGLNTVSVQREGRGEGGREREREREREKEGGGEGERSYVFKISYCPL